MKLATAVRLLQPDPEAQKVVDTYTTSMFMDMEKYCTERHKHRAKTVKALLSPAPRLTMKGYLASSGRTAYQFSLLFPTWEYFLLSYRGWLCHRRNSS